ncbi:unnamed protein product [Tenebrio molitor]|nr:unnamed protein product [Tenebrio molitor]
MANVPCTILVFTEDTVNFPMKKAKVVMRQLFQYGVKEISGNRNAIFISLTYSPKEITLKKKFGNLPIRYIRTHLENDGEFKTLERVVRRYKFNVAAKNVEDQRQPQIKTDNDDDDEEGLKELLLQDAKEFIRVHDPSQNQSNRILSNIDKKNKLKRKKPVWDDEEEERIVMMKKN